MKHRLFAIIMALPLVAIFAGACNEIETASIDSDVTKSRHITETTPSIQVSQSEANAIADMFMCSGAFNNGIATKGSARVNLTSASQTIREKGQDLMYVFNYEDGGFVITGATREYYPILAYSEDGTFILQDDMGPIDVWLDETKVSIQNSGSLDAVTKEQMRSLWARYEEVSPDVVLEQLPVSRPLTRSTGEDACWERIETLQALYGSEGWTFNSLSGAEYYFNEWGFEDLYDEICYNAAQNHSDPSETVIGYKYPVYNHIGPLLSTEWHQNAPYNDLCPNHYPAGCTAIASGQVMKYFEYPTTMSWNDTIFTWTDIPVTPTTTSKHPQLIRMLGQLFNMQYSQNESVATASGVINGLTSLGYSVTQPETHSYSAVRDTLLNSRKPILMLGYRNYNLTGGHMWVCDGLTESIANQIIYFTENQPYGAGTFTQGLYTHNNPGVFGGNSFYYVLHINWCYGENNVDQNGWFVANDFTPGNGVYKYGRKNIYIMAPGIGQ